MSTHNIGFYEDLTKIIFELSSNILKYVPYFFCCFLYLPGTTLSCEQGARELLVPITKTRPCNIQQYFMAVKMLIFR